MTRPTDPDFYADWLATQITSGAALSNMPELEHLVRGLMFRDTLVLAHGDKRAFKSFWAMDLAFSITDSRVQTFHGLDMSTRDRIGYGEVFYICAEGGPGFARRRAAFYAHRGLEPPNEHDDMLTVLPRPLNLLSRDWADALVECLTDDRGDPFDYDLVVIDTASRMMPGADENAQGPMSQFVQQLDRIREAAGSATVLVIGHDARGTDHARGSTVLENACDTVLAFKREGDALTVRVEKQKDGPEPTYRYGSTIVTLGTDAWGEPITSIALTDDAPAELGLSPGMVEMLEALDAIDIGAGVSNSLWLSSQTAVGRSTFYRHVKRLETLGHIENRLTTARPAWSVSDLGKQLVRPTVSRPSHDVPETAVSSCPTVPHTLRGGTSGTDTIETVDTEHYETDERYAEMFHAS